MSGNPIPHRDGVSGQIVSGPPHDSPKEVVHADNSSSEAFRRSFQRGCIAEGRASPEPFPSPLPKDSKGATGNGLRDRRAIEVPGPTPQAFDWVSKLQSCDSSG